jgi:acetyl-CoA C-acetyltransferase
MATGIKDKVAILGMGCSRFGERWDAGSPELMAEAFSEALADAGVERSQIEAAWFGCYGDAINVGNSSIPAAMALRLDGIPVSRLENMCATGTEALRGATYAVASGAVDIALAIGSEKLKDTGYGGLPSPFKGTFNDLWMPMASAPAGFAQLAAGYRARYGMSQEDLKRAISHVSWKSHQNGVHSPKAHFRKAVSMDTIVNAPMIADPLGLFD